MPGLSLNKIDQIKSLKNEVKEFHPLLKELFKKLPNIEKCEYTHGVHEMGADFVLTKSDPTLNRNSYIGVVVKTGTIKQNHDDVERQVKECSVPRKINGGKEKIILNEIWVVTNSGISNGAKEKIHNEYRDKNIQFVTGEDVVHFIDSFYPEYWTDISIDLGNYFREVSDSSKYLTKQIDLLDITDSSGLDIEYRFHRFSEVTRTDPGRKKSPKIYKLEDILEKERYILVQGGMGTGKSSIISKLTKKFATSEHFNSTKTVPFSLTFHDFVNKYNSDINNIVDLIDKQVKQKDIGYLIMIDGLDELDESDEDKINRLKELHSSSYQVDNCTVLITSRQFDDVNLENKVEKYFSIFNIIPLSVKQIVGIVQHICNSNDTRSKLLKDLEKSHLFKVLPKTPISAIILAKLLKQNVQEIPSTMTELYAKYTEIVLGRWNIDKGLQSQQEYDTCQNVVANVAKYMLDNQLPQLSIHEFKQMFDDYVNARKLQIDSEMLFETLISNDELFIWDTDRGVIDFVHRSFSEYFYAIYLNRDNSAVINEDIYTLYWSNVYFFFFGLNRDSEILVNELTRIKFSSQEARLAHVFHNGNLLLAAHQTPYEFIKKCVLNSYKEASDFYEQVITNKISTPLSELPKIHILSIVSYGLATSYGYDFFIDILEERAYEIAKQTGNPTDVEMAELFFINSTLLYNDKFDSFDVMINKYGKHIPLEFQIGIQHYFEIKKSGKHTPVVKRFVKELKKQTQKTLGTRQAILNLIEKPIKESA